MMSHYLASAIGGVCIGVSAAVFLLLNDRVAGIAGIVDGVFRGYGASLLNRLGEVALAPTPAIRRMRI